MVWVIVCPWVYWVYRGRKHAESIGKQKIKKATRIIFWVFFWRGKNIACWGRVCMRQATGNVGKDTKKKRAEKTTKKERKK